MKCLLTGGAGFLGRMLASGLRESGADVTIADLRELPGYRSRLVDVTCAETLAWGGERFDILVHAAGLAHRRAAGEAERRRFFEVNEGGTRKLLGSLEAGRAPGLAVLISTVAVYGREEGELLGEETPLHAPDAYGASKRAAEEAFLAWAERNRVRWAILRLPLVWGPDPPGNLGAMAAAMRAGRYCGIGSGEARRSLVWGMDVGRALLRAARTGGVFHLTDGRHPRFREIEEAMAAGLGLRPPRRIPGWAGWCAAAAGSLAEAAAGWRAPLNLERYRKMTRTLTFADAKARREFGWEATSVLDRMRAGGVVHAACH